MEGNLSDISTAHSSNASVQVSLNSKIDNMTVSLNNLRTSITDMSKEVTDMVTDMNSMAKKIGKMSANIGTMSDGFKEMALSMNTGFEAMVKALKEKKSAN